MITGWKTVPINPTLAMLAEGERAMHELGWERFTERVWQRMLAAVEEPQAEIVAWRGINPRTGEVELCGAFLPAPSVMRDFNMRPLYLSPCYETKKD